VVIETLEFSFLLAVQAPRPAQQKPFSQNQVQALVRDGLGDETGAKALEQRGIDFAPTEDFIRSLKAAGASEAFLAALRAAVAPGLSPAQRRGTGILPVLGHGQDGQGAPAKLTIRSARANL
jgi:hypothetical protein